MLRGCKGRGVLGMGPGVMEVGEPNNPITPLKLHVVVSVCEWKESEKIHYLSVWRIRNKSKRSLCVSLGQWHLHVVQDTPATVGIS